MKVDRSGSADDLRSLATTVPILRGEMARFEKLSRKSVLQLTSISVSIRRGSSCPPLVKARRSGIAAAITEDSLPNVDMKLRHPGSIIEKIRKLQFKTCGNLSADVKFVTCPAQLSPRWVFPAGVMQVRPFAQLLFSSSLAGARPQLLI